MFKISLIINSILSAFFIGLVVFNILSEKEISNLADFFVIGYILVVYSIFLWFNFICFKINSLQQQMPVEMSFSKTGKVLSVIVIILAIIVIVFSLLAVFPFLLNASPNNTSQVIGFIVFIALSLFSASTAIINAVLHRKSIKQNKSIVNSVINTIGENTSQ